MTPVLQNGLVYMGDGKVLRPNGDEEFFDMYTLTFPTEGTADMVLSAINNIIAGEGWKAEPKFSYTFDGLRWVVEVTKDGQVLPNPLDIGLLAQTANTQEDPPRALAVAIKTQLGLLV